MINLNFLKNKKYENNDLYIQDLQKVINDIDKKLSTLRDIREIISHYNETGNVRVEVYGKSFISRESAFKADKEFIEYLEQKRDRLINELEKLQDE